MSHLLLQRGKSDFGRSEIVFNITTTMAAPFLTELINLTALNGTRYFALLDADACIFVISKAYPEHILRSLFHEMLPFSAPEQPCGFQSPVRAVSFYLCNVI
jgi:hypothetical protein